MSATVTASGFTMHSTALLGVAYKSAVRARSASALGELTDDSLSAIILASSAAEGFLNDTVAIILMVAGHGALGNPRSADSERLVGIAEALDELEEERCSVRAKYLAAGLLLGGAKIKKGSEPFQSFDDLYALRNGIVHAKPLPFESADRQTRIAASLAQKGLANPLKRDPSGSPTGDSWLNQIQTPQTARWAADSAAEIMITLAECFAAITGIGGLFSTQASQIRLIQMTHAAQLSKPNAQS